MLNKDGVRELAYLVRVDAITAMDADRLECAHVGGWKCVVGKGELKEGDVAVYFEIDSKLPEVAPFNEMEFLKSKHYAIKSQKIRGVVSQGLLMPVTAFGWEIKYGCFGWEPEGYAFFGDKVEGIEPEPYAVDKVNGKAYTIEGESRFLTKQLGVTYAVSEDNARKAPSADKYKAMAQRKPDVFKKKWARWMMKREWGRKVMFALFGKKKDQKGWPVGKFSGVSKTDQERCENMTWILNDKTPFIRTQKCDGSSGTYILARKPFGRYEFYVCSRNVRMYKPDQECFYDQNYYWEVAKKYDIEAKMKDYLKKNKDTEFVCWQGEICGPGIQSNPQKLTETHFFCFHMTDSKVGRYDIREAKKIWESYGMEVVPIEDELYIMPDDFEEFKITADGKYDPVVCEGNKSCDREGFVYYKSNDPTFSFKNVSRKYLLKHQS